MSLRWKGGKALPRPNGCAVHGLRARPPFWRKGGHITRHYGQPAQNSHAVQLEMTQCSYMQEALPFDYLPEVAAGVQPYLRRMLEAALAFAAAQSV